MEELKPCPFCGNARNIALANEKHDHSGGYFIACPECDASTGLRYALGDDPRPALAEAWNRRAEPQAVAVPPGYVLVPVEPTIEMGWAYLDAANAQDPLRHHVFNHDGYRAMVKAAMAAQKPTT